MADWIYDPDEGLIFEYREFPDTKNPVPITIAENVNPDAGPTLAMAKRMEAWMRNFEDRRLAPEDFARLHDEALAIFREIGKAREDFDALD